MHLTSIPRHRIETSLSDYIRILTGLLEPRERADVFAKFEREFAEYVGCKHAIAVSSGRLGLHLILSHFDFEPGDEAIIPAFNLFAVIEQFRQRGLVPRFCDVSKEDLNIDIADVERRITPKTKVILATHMYGHPVDMNPLLDLAGRHNLVVLEDCAHALGSQYESKFVGTFGRAAIFSFSVLKLVTTFGGGMIATDDDELARRIRRDLSTIHALRPKPAGLKRALMGTIMDLGTRPLVFSFAAWPVLRAMRWLKPDIQKKIMTETPHSVTGFTPQRVARMHPFQAMLGRRQLAKAERLIARRKEVVPWLDEELAGIESIELLRHDHLGRSNGLYYGILAKRAAELSSYLFCRGIDTETSEYSNCADLDIYSDCAVDCPVACDVQARILRLPNYPHLSRADVSRIGQAIRRFYR
ncbi:MAG: DegT/DnrJ/EryC1/StrS family aminotransferase [Phycisphaerales bacterium]|nr:MAG: DegT/DnrJ/EryC1/StrS family aminotransferase [Phycisphaerales bacterium]